MSNDKFHNKYKLKYNSEEISKKEGSLRYASSDIGLSKKIRTNIGNISDKLYWYLRFNLELDEDTVNKKNMRVTDLENYILKTEVSYNKKSNVIVILPVDSYEENCYYILHISGKVKSSKGTPLKQKVRILFKLNNQGQVESYNVLDKNAKDGEIKDRPRDYEYKMPNKVTGLDKSIYDSLPQDKLPQAPMKIKLWLGLLGLIVLLASFATMNVTVIIIGLVLALLSLGALIKDILVPENLSIIHYNLGVSRFNKAEYKKANISFKKSIMYDEYNEMAEVALGKIKYYL